MSDCVALSLASRRLHSVAFPFALFKCGVVDSASLSSDKFTIRSSAQSGLSYLRFALFLDSINHIEFRLAPGCANLQEFVRFLSKPNLHVEEATLNCTNLALFQYKPGKNPLIHYHEGRSVVWDKPFRQLTQALAQRSCTSLTILGGGVTRVNGCNVGGFYNPISPSRIFNRLGKSDSFSNAPPSPHCDLFPIRTLKTLDIRSPLVFQSPFLGWIISTANMSPITQLHLRLNYKASWELLLRNLFLPSISSLSVGNHGTSTKALDLFLIRHPTITTLDIRGSYFNFFGMGGLPTNPISDASPILPRLAVLQTTPELLTHLLLCRGRTMFPTLEAITIEPFIPSRDGWFPAHSISTDSGFGDLDDALSALSEACGNKHGIFLTLRLYTQDPDFLPWLKNIVTSGMDDGQRPDKQRRVAYWASMHCVQKLHIQTLHGVPFEDTAADMIPRWISMLTSLRDVSFSGVCLKWMTAAVRQDFEIQIMESCPGVRAVGFDTTM